MVMEKELFKKLYAEFSRRFCYKLESFLVFFEKLCSLQGGLKKKWIIFQVNGRGNFLRSFREIVMA